jgi:CMP-N,N'-diacetyllegionaminic acid synthase
MEKNRVVVFIPARGGSKRIPRKNIAKVGGHPIIAYSINVGLEICGKGNVFVSTDDIEIAKVARSYGAVVENLRPGSLAGDDSRDVDWLIYEVKQLDLVDAIVIILRPTSPLRSSKTIGLALEKFIDSGADSLRAVQRVREHPGKMWKLKNGRLFPLLKQPLFGEKTFSRPTQSLDEIWVQNASLEITRARRVLRERTLSGRDILGFEMPNLEGFDLNDESDWVLLNSYIQSNPGVLPQIGKK